MRGEKIGSKSDLMRRYFIEALNHASGGEGKKAPVRQIFYTIRAIINLNHPEKKLSEKTDYQTFTQRVATRMIEEHPELEDRVLFEARGFWLNPFWGREYALSTATVSEIINRKVKDEVRQVTRMTFDIPDNLEFNHVLFIEKQGFTIPLKEAGLIDELNLGIMSSAGYGTRAAKKLMEHFIKQGIRPYVLTDCDIGGYLISNRFGSGSKTFKKELDVEWIGLTVADVDRLGKRSEAEEVKYKSKKKGDTDYEGNDPLVYDECLQILTEEEYDFLVIDKAKNEYRRVEINTLTIPELVRFIKSKIKRKPIKPTLEQIESYIEIDEEEIVKMALMKVYGETLNVDIDIGALAKRIRKAISKKEHWAVTMKDEIESFMNEKSDELAEEMGLQT